jgi:dihydroxyacid dehydratase/phosphogluconate dehydratase
MDAKAHIILLSASRPGTDGLAQLTYGAPLPALRRGIAINLSERVKTFKKTPCAAGLKLAGRDVAKDMLDFASIPLPTKSLLDHCDLHADFVTATGAMIAENSKAVKRKPHQDAVRSANTLTAVTGGVVGLKGIRVSLPGTGQADTGAGHLNAKLTDKELAVRPSKSKSRATNHTSGTLWNYARRVGAAGIGTAPRLGRAHEKQCYADI